jgi:hypothetical protein
MLSTADLDRVVDSSGTADKESRIEAIELEAMGAVQASLASGSFELARSVRPQVEELTRSDLVSIRNPAQAVLQELQSAAH